MAEATTPSITPDANAEPETDPTATDADDDVVIENGDGDEEVDESGAEENMAEIDDGNTAEQPMDTGDNPLSTDNDLPIPKTPKGQRLFSAVQSYIEAARAKMVATYPVAIDDLTTPVLRPLLDKCDHSFYESNWWQEKNGVSGQVHLHFKTEQEAIEAAESLKTLKNDINVFRWTAGSEPPEWLSKKISDKVFTEIGHRLKILGGLTPSVKESDIAAEFPGTRITIPIRATIRRYGVACLEYPNVKAKFEAVKGRELMVGDCLCVLTDCLTPAGRPLRDETVASHVETLVTARTKLATRSPTMIPAEIVNVIRQIRKVQATLSYDEDLKKLYGMSNPLAWKKQLAEQLDQKNSELTSSKERQILQHNIQQLETWLIPKEGGKRRNRGTRKRQASTSQDSGEPSKRPRNQSESNNRGSNRNMPAPKTGGSGGRSQQNRGSQQGSKTANQQSRTAGPQQRATGQQQRAAGQQQRAAGQQQRGAGQQQKPRTPNKQQQNASQQRAKGQTPMGMEAKQGNQNRGQQQQRSATNPRGRNQPARNQPAGNRRTIQEAQKRKQKSIKQLQRPRADLNRQRVRPLLGQGQGQRERSRPDNEYSRYRDQRDHRRTYSGSALDSRHEQWYGNDRPQPVMEKPRPLMSVPDPVPTPLIAPEPAANQATALNLLVGLSQILSKKRSDEIKPVMSLPGESLSGFQQPSPQLVPDSTRYLSGYQSSSQMDVGHGVQSQYQRPQQSPTALYQDVRGSSHRESDSRTADYQEPRSSSRRRRYEKREYDDYRSSGSKSGYQDVRSSGYRSSDLAGGYQDIRSSDYRSSDLAGAYQDVRGSSYRSADSSSGYKVSDLATSPQYVHGSGYQLEGINSQAYQDLRGSTYQASDSKASYQYVPRSSEYDPHESSARRSTSDAYRRSTPTYADDDPYRSGEYGGSGYQRY